MEKQLFIYDLETYPNFFLAVFKSIDTKEYYYFEISDRKSEQISIKKFLSERVKGLIGFNNLNFDYPVLHNTLLKSNKLLTPQEIYKEVEVIINSQYSSVWDNQIKIPQLDLYRIWHYDNKNKSTSLKWLEFAMRLPNVEDLPYKPGTVLTSEQMDHIIEYCKNDIEATEMFYYKSLKHIEIRKFYTNLEGINLISASEIKMSKQIFGKYLAKEMKIDIKHLNTLRTEREIVEIKDVIFDYIKFNDPINNNVLNFYQNAIWRNIKGDDYEGLSYAVNYKNVIRQFAEGGLHSFGKPGIYESNNEYMLVDVDFASYYPHISFRNKLHPEHIPEKLFSEIYEGFYKDRKQYPKSDPRNYVLKIILNGSYGLSKDKYAFLYDPKWQLAICINGQLMLAMLTEAVFEACQYEPQIIFENTDGAMYRIKRTDYQNLKLACDRVAEIVKIPLEIQECQKIIARDVNNYINIINNDDIKFKGCFEIDRDFHKNHSKRIIPIALAEYFINGNKPEYVINNYISNSERLGYSTNMTNNFYKNYGIYDFCLGAKMKGKNELVERYWKNNILIENPLSKMNRYYVSNNGVELIKKLPPLEKHFLTETDKHKIKTGEQQLNIFDFIEDVKVDAINRDENLEAGYKCTIFNKYNESNYDLNYDYYIKECYSIIDKLK